MEQPAQASPVSHLCQYPESWTNAVFIVFRRPMLDP